jgi:hypothetical protein
MMPVASTERVSRYTQKVSANQRKLVVTFATAELVGALEQGEASEILGRTEDVDTDSDALERATDLASEGAAFDAGTD